MFHKLMGKARRNNKGFTLVELMVVVAIIGILAAIAVPKFTDVTANAEKNACHANLRAIDSAKAMYNASPTGVTWPGDFFQGGALPECPGTGEYTKSAPTDTDKARCTVHETYGEKD